MLWSKFRSIAGTPSCADLSRASTSLPRGKTWMAVTSTAMTWTVHQFERNVLQVSDFEIRIISSEHMAMTNGAFLPAPARQDNRI